MNWLQFIQQQKQQAYFQSLTDFVQQQRQQHQVYPEPHQVFSAFDACDLDQVNVVILGQDPYHGANQAHGLAFSVQPGLPIPPSLKNIFKELSTDIEHWQSPEHGCLQSWAKQGVLLLNTVLTVNAGQANSHANAGWQQFTDATIKLLNQQTRPLVFLLWGGAAQKKSLLIDQPQHHILKAPHPSPLSAYRGFFGCQHFSRCNQLLLASGQTPIRWQLSSLNPQKDLHF